MFFWITSPFCSNVSWLQTQLVPWRNMLSWLPPLPDFLSCQILKILIPVGSTRSSNPIVFINFRHFRYIITPPKVLQSLQVSHFSHAKKSSMVTSPPFFSSGKPHVSYAWTSTTVAPGLDVALQMWLRAVKRDIRISLAAPRWQSANWNEFDQ